jgi:hypothetical protein
MGCGFAALEDRIRIRIPGNSRGGQVSIAASLAFETTGPVTAV